MWTSTHDYVLRKWSSPCQHRYGLEFKVKHKILHLVLCILLAGDIATNPGLVQNTALHCLSFNALSLKSVNKHEDGSTTSNVSMFQDLVYSENFDIITVTETWLNDTISNKEILLQHTKKRSYDWKTRRWCFDGIREGLQYDTITPKD
jgi:hypothetical protein